VASGPSATVSSSDQATDHPAAVRVRSQTLPAPDAAAPCPAASGFGQEKPTKRALPTGMVCETAALAAAGFAAAAGRVARGSAMVLAGLAAAPAKAMATGPAAAAVRVSGTSLTVPGWTRRVPSDGCTALNRVSAIAAAAPAAATRRADERRDRCTVRPPGLRRAVHRGIGTWPRT
jgi:hypothetical protein